MACRCACSTRPDCARATSRSSGSGSNARAVRSAPPRSRSSSSTDRARSAAVRAAIAQAGWQSETLDLARPHLASARQAGAVARAREALAHAQATLDAGEPVDPIVPELIGALAALGEITGAAATEALLDGVFARFCIGK